MLQRLRIILMWLCAGAAAACFVAYVILKAGPEPGQPGLWAALWKYGVEVTVVLAFVAIALAFYRQLLLPAGEDDLHVGADDATYQRYRVRGGFALVVGGTFVLLGGIDQLLHIGDDAMRQSSWTVGLGMVLLAVGSVYRYDLPTIYRRVSDLEDRLQRRIDALANGHGGNGNDHGGKGTGPPDSGELDDHARFRP